MWAHHWPRILEFFLTLSSGKEDLAMSRKRGLRRGVPDATRIHLAGSLQRKASMPLRSATCCRVPKASPGILVVFSALGLFFYYLASFFIQISPCPIKHYSTGD